MARYADLALPGPVRTLFTYEIPDGMAVEPGLRVWVPLRKENVIGLVVHVHDRPPEFETRPVLGVIDSGASLTPTGSEGPAHAVASQELLRLADWVSRYYFCSMGEVLQAALPSGLNFVSEKRLRLSEDALAELAQAEEAPEGEGDAASRPPRLEVLAEIQAAQRRGAGMKLNDARRRWKGLSLGKTLEALLKQEAIQVWHHPKPQTLPPAPEASDPPAPDAPTPDPAAPEAPHTDPPTLDPLKTLNPEQDAALQSILEGVDARAFHSYLLHGVTGSGKTEVYIHAMARVLAQGRAAMVLVPEIALTPQTVNRFTRVFGDQVAVLHSRLTPRERLDAWLDLARGRRRIAIGPRSAVFAPLPDLGLLVVDEEHDGSYKQFDPAPRYHARDVALVRAKTLGAVVILGSATPSITTRYAAESGKHTLLTLAGRPFGAMPEVKILDMKQYRPAMRGPLAVPLFRAIETALSKREQAILLLNRRGFASYLQCEACGHIPESPECSVSLTYHRARNLLLCHYTGYSRRADTRCEACGSEEITLKGSGTEQVENAVQELFPDARLVRMDRDTTAGRTDHARIYTQVLERRADILIGTQMLAKGLDFPHVTVVGVLQAENELAFPSWRSSERLFQLLSQVSGRAGRDRTPGKVFIQTWKPDHPAVRTAREHDYAAFERTERLLRARSFFPPYSRMVLFHFKGASKESVALRATAFTETLRALTSDGAVLGPSPAVVERMQGHYHWQVSLKLDSRTTTAQQETLLDRILQHADRAKPPGTSSVRITVDVDVVE